MLARGNAMTFDCFKMKAKKLYCNFYSIGHKKASKIDKPCQIKWL